MTSNLVDASNV